MTGVSVYVPDGAPVFDRRGWDDLSIHYNCYAYALRLPGHGWGVPGLLKTGADSHGAFTVELMAQRLKDDGLEPVREHGADPLRDHIVAAFVRSAANEFHFYSLDRDGTWSHKRGRTGISRLDASFSAITDPRRAEAQTDLRDITDFAGFYRVPDRGIAYRKDADLDRRFRIALHKRPGYRK